MSFDILNRWMQAVVYHSEDCSKLSPAAIEAIAKGVNLQGAYLRGVNLQGADLQGVNLQDAYLRGANLQGVNLRDADLQGVNLRDAYLQGAYLQGANLQGVNLRDAYLRGANLQGVNLRGVNLQGVNLQGAKGITPVVLQIGGTRDWIIVREAGHVTIGCEDHPLIWWEEHYAAIGRTNRYTDEQVAEYRAHIAYCRQWMEAHGIAEIATEVKA